MEKLDRLVTENLMERLFKPERMSALLASLAARRAEKAESLSGRLIALQRQITEAEDKLVRIRGSKDVLEKAIFASQNGASCSQMGTNWRASQNKTANTYTIEFSV
jgi:hypothetical protein